MTSLVVSLLGLLSVYAADTCDSHLTGLDLTLATYNMAMRGQSEEMDAKKEWQKIGLAKQILDAAPSILITQEATELAAFNSQYLENAYIPVEIEGNDPFQNMLGILIRRDLPFDFEIRTYKNERTESGYPVFMRDFPLVLFRAKGAPLDTWPLFIVAGAHFKRGGGDLSKRLDRKASLPRTIARLEAERAAEILSELRLRYGAGTPIFLAGDLNGDFNLHPNYAKLREDVKLVNPMQLASALYPKARYTHVEVDVLKQGKYKKPVLSELDYVLVNEEALPWIDSPRILRYLTANGQIAPPPRRKLQAAELYSDHRMVALTFRFGRYFNRQ